MSTAHELALRIRGVIAALCLAVGDVERGLYKDADRARLASYLDALAAALRVGSTTRQGPVVDSLRVNETGQQPAIEPPRADQ
ncbi:hypothetical protein [Saccharopolyspora phatthalungensis]|uniref:Uncharacterized protein n=1 Tax=Saccharopolyspora phatthalungensis TaxID=664693 RepID=A0A840QE73_9PSEU|nr:hypothetical protein [Saccharopolyspora phatthalungensis]MBB5156775.1 hypothetical protein [Saccharopolyspora phatthalungensis]